MRRPVLVEAVERSRPDKAFYCLFIYNSYVDAVYELKYRSRLPASFSCFYDIIYRALADVLYSLESVSYASVLAGELLLGVIH